MTVRELIAQLQQCNQDLIVCRRNSDPGSEDRYESDEAIEIERVMPPGNYLDADAVVLS